MYNPQAVAKRHADAKAQLVARNAARSSIHHTPISKPYARPTPRTPTQAPPSLLPPGLHPSIQLSPETSAGLARALQNGLAKQTQQNYTSAVNAFLNFCDRKHIDQDLRFPAHEFVLCAFIGSLTGNRSGQTAANVIAGLKSWHELHGQPWLGGYTLTHVIRGAALLAPASTKRPQRPPVSTHMLVLLHDGLDHNNRRDIAIFATATTAFWGQCRLGELLGSSRSRHDASARPSRTSLITPASDQSAVELILPRTKTNRVSGQSIFLTRQREPISPISALASHLRSNNNVPPSHHIFAFHNAQGGISCLTKEVFLARCNDIWSRHRIPRMTGHSFRIGGTHAYLTAGVPDDVVKKLGRWTSDAFLRYWRGLDQLATLHTQHL